jgi:hypothetical protein
MKRNISLLLAAVMILSLFAACAGSQSPPDLGTYTIGSTKSSSSNAEGVIRNDAPTDAKDEWITPEEYVVIELGMTLEEVQSIIGSEGKGKKQGPFMFYTWTGFDLLGNIVTMSFKDDILMNKDPQERNVGGVLPTMEEALAYFEALGMADAVEEAQETAEENQEELGIEVPEEETAPEDGGEAVEEETEEVPESEG